MKIIRLNEVKDKTGLSRTSIYNMMKFGIFPKQISISSRSVGWIEDEIDEWIMERINRSRGIKD